MFGGAVWGVSMISLIVSNELNGQTITYPLTTTIPGIVATLWSVLLFKEINVSDGMNNINCIAISGKAKLHSHRHSFFVYSLWWNASYVVETQILINLRAYF
jgi:hypothetical protein